MPAVMSVSGDPSVQICSFRPADQAACGRLYADGLVGGSLSENDTCADLADIESAYLKCPGSHFWVAEVRHGIANGGGQAGGGCEVVGMVGVQHHDAGTGEIRRLRVATGYRRRGIGSALVETALRFCEERNYLKVTLDTFMEREPAIRLFEKFRFRHFRTRNFAGKDLMYFLLDLYAGDHHAPQGEQPPGQQQQQEEQQPPP
jgi:ribosomal protein S18 acetylase RimI-like enzyme